MTVDLATGRYSTFDSSMGVAVGTSVGRPRWPLSYKLEHEVRRLAPWGLLDVKDPYEFSRRYIERLDRLDLDALVQKLEHISAQHGGARLVLLCYEDVHAGQLCHRRVFAEFWQERRRQRVPEIETYPGQNKASLANFNSMVGRDNTTRPRAWKASTDDLHEQ